ncbi:hypothetical protein AB0F91_39920 [Amycolatopsis sp. NPDC023774]|uniref:hypothetical protein n=1 Tax=Amycolatopsis sp. NPDC023774 TaxID=3155015 RepID=UPI00340E3BB3
MSWITTLSATVNATPILATGAAWVLPRLGRSTLRTTAFATVATVAGARLGLPFLDTAMGVHIEFVNVGLTILATLTSLLWLASLAPRVLRTTARFVRSSTPRPRTAAASPVTVPPATADGFRYDGDTYRCAEQEVQHR